MCSSSFLTSDKPTVPKTIAIDIKPSKIKQLTVAVTIRRSQHRFITVVTVYFSDVLAVVSDRYACFVSTAAFQILVLKISLSRP